MTRLPNGAAVLSLSRPYGSSAAVGLWLLNGSRHQDSHEGGMAHLLEHALLDTSQPTVDTLGELINGHSGRELTALTGQAPASEALELAQFFSRRLLTVTAAELWAAEPVLRREAEARSSPLGRLQQMLLAYAWEHHPLSAPLDALPQLATLKLDEYLQRLRVGPRVALAATGRVEHQALVAAAAPLAALPAGARPSDSPPRFRGGALALSPLAPQQRLLLWLLPLPPPSAATYPAALLARAAMTRQLYGALRQRGLVYGLTSEPEFYTDAGVWWLYCFCAEAVQAEAAALTAAVVDALDAATIDRARRQLIAQLWVAEDDLMERLLRLGRSYFYGADSSLGALKVQLEAVDPDAVKRLLRQLWSQRLQVRA